MPKICLKYSQNIHQLELVKLSPLPTQSSHMFVTLALVKRGRVGVPDSGISYFWSNFTLPNWSKQ